MDKHRSGTASTTALVKELRVAERHLADGAPLFVRQGRAALRACARIMEECDRRSLAVKILKAEVERVEERESQI